MTPKKLQEILKDAVKHGEQLLIVGPPGIGKTDIVKAVCKDLGADMIISHPAVSDPTDYKGLPFKVSDNSHAEFLPFGETWRAIQADKVTLWFIDDLGQASEAVQKALMQLLLGRKLNGHKLSDKVVFCGATNDIGHRAGVTGLLEPVKSRWDSIVNLEPSLDDWCTWAYGNGQPAELIAFLRNCPELLSHFEPTKALINQPCPRTWASVGRRIARNQQDFDLIAGAVGKGAAQELLAFLELAAKAPSLDAILMNPKTAPIPEKPALLYLVAAGLSQRAKKDNFNRVYQYLLRLPQSFRTMAIKDAINRDNSLTGTDTFTAYVTSAEGKSIL
jgi:MoxR-like ATPase